MVAHQLRSVFRNSSPNNGRVDLRGDFVIEADLYLGDKDSNGVSNSGSGIAFNLTGSNNYGSYITGLRLLCQFIMP